MFKRLANLVKGFFGLFVGGLEKQNPEALLEVEKENLRKQISEFNKGLASHAGIVERLISRVKKLDAEENTLRTKAKANLKAGNRKLAGEYALKLKKVEAEHDQIKIQFEDADKRYKELMRARDVSVKTAKEKIEEIRQGIDGMKVEKAMAELNEMATGMVTEIGGSGDTLNRLEGIVEEERTKAAGRARVAKDSLDLSDIESEASEQDALAELALAELAAEEGMELGDESPAATTSSPAPESEDETTGGSMGPGVSQ